MRASIPVLLVAVLALAGCTEAPAPTSFTFSAAGGKVSPGWAYDGAGVAPGAATLAGTLDDPENAGSVNVSFEINGSKYVALFAAFSGAEAWKDGGVRSNFDEHVDTGNGDASLPKAHAKVAAWGTASLTKDGVPLLGSGGSPAWSAHLMLLDDTLRAADGRILNAAGTAPYDPTKPTDATVVGGDPQAFFYVLSPDGADAARPPVNGTKTIDCASPTCTGSVDVPAEEGAVGVVINITFTGGATPVGVGRATATLKDAEGNATKTQEVNVAPNQATTVSWTLAAAEIDGPYKVEIAGAGVFTAQVDHLVTYDDHPFVVVTWDEYTVT